MPLPFWQADIRTRLLHRQAPYPVYFARDRAYTEYYYQGQGTWSSTPTSAWRLEPLQELSPTDPTEVAEVHYNAGESGVAPKEGEERPKPQTQAAN